MPCVYCDCEIFGDWVDVLGEVMHPECAKQFERDCYGERDFDLWLDEVDGEPFEESDTTFDVPSYFES